MSKIARLGVVINPTAGQGRGKKDGLKALSELANAGYDVLDLSGDDGATAFGRAWQERDNYDALVVVGGDGMAHLGINVVANTSIPLGLIPAGSGNDLARHLQLPIHDVPAAVTALTTAWHDGPQLLDAIALTPEPPGHLSSAGFDPQHRWVGCVVSAGFDSMVTARANTYHWPRGVGRYIRAVVRELLTFEPYRYRVWVDGEETSFDGTLIALANAPSFGGGMRIAPESTVVDGLMDIVIAGEVSRLELLRVFPRIFKGSHTIHPAVRVLKAQEVRIAPQEGATIPEIFADGELVGRAPVRARIQPGAVRMLCPRVGV